MGFRYGTFSLLSCFVLIGGGNSFHGSRSTPTTTFVQKKYFLGTCVWLPIVTGLLGAARAVAHLHGYVGNPIEAIERP